MPIVDSKRNGKIHFEVVGKGAPVALIAGMGGAASYWKPQIEAFAARYAVVLHDQRGSGQSSMDAIEYSVAQMSDDLLAVLDELQIEAVHCVGHAAGAVIAQELALKHPQRVASIVMVGSWARIDPYFRRVFEIRKDLLRNSGRLAYVRAMPLFLNTPEWVSRNIDVLEATEPAFAEHLSPTEILLSRIDALCAYEPGESLRKVVCPTLVCSAKDDHLVPMHCSRELAQLIPKVEAHYFETGGHSVSQVDPDRFNEVVIGFLDRIIAASKRPSSKLQRVR